MKWRKKPVVIDAMQWDGTNLGELREFFGAFQNWGIADSEYVLIQTLEGEHTANPGDWIIKGVKGEFYPCKPEIFALTYEPAELTSAADAVRPATEQPA